jgi:palmitoyl-protein thioesterase
MGISSLIPCPTPPTLTCLLAARAARSGIYTHYAQSKLIQAQYYRDPARLNEFLDVNTFLRDINGEGPVKGSAGKGVGMLDNLVAVFFEADRMSDHPVLSMEEKEGVLIRVHVYRNGLTSTIRSFRNV